MGDSPIMGLVARLVRALQAVLIRAGNRPRGVLNAARQRLAQSGVRGRDRGLVTHERRRTGSPPSQSLERTPTIAVEPARSVDVDKAEPVEADDATGLVSAGRGEEPEGPEASPRNLTVLAPEQPPIREIAETDSRSPDDEELSGGGSATQSVEPGRSVPVEPAQSVDLVGEPVSISPESTQLAEEPPDSEEGAPEKSDVSRREGRRAWGPPRRSSWPPGSEGARLAQAAESYRVDDWNQALFEELLPLQPHRGMPVLLACDDETVRVVGERLGYESGEATAHFAEAVRISFGINAQRGLLDVARLGGAFERQRHPRPLPEYFAALCLLVLAASRMGADAQSASVAYYPRLRLLLGLPGGGALPRVEYIPELFRQLAVWLADDLAGSRGHLILPDDFSPRYVGACVSQTVFREVDRQVLSKFFSERMRGPVDGFDPLRRLRRWSGRHQLTQHALELVEDEAVAERVRAAIVSAHRSWDGAELIETRVGELGRTWPARLRFLPYPPRLHLAAANARPLEFELRGERYLLEPESAVEVPWKLLDWARSRPLILGEATSSAGAVQVPAVGNTLLFELSEEGLNHVERPSGEEVWVLTRDRALQSKLDGFRFRDNRVPEEWRVYRDVTLEKLPEVERAVAPREKEEFRLEGGLPLPRRVYLSDHSPRLSAGDLGYDGRLTVFVNGRAIGTVASGEHVGLPAEPGDYVVAVEQEWETRYHVDEFGDPDGYGSLAHDLDSPRGLRSGARPRRAKSKTTICGASISIPHKGDTPILTRTSATLFSLDVHGELGQHQRPSTPAWFQRVGLSGGWRWEIVRPDVVWLLCLEPALGPPWAQLYRSDRIERLSPKAARVVVRLGGRAHLRSRQGAVDDAEEAWRALIELAERSEA
jgi:hypothetical protein